MIKITVIDGRNAPKFCCDICGQPINKAGEGAIVHSNFMDEGKTTDAVMVHKDFAGQGCLSKAEGQIRAAGGSPGWQELRATMAHLAFNHEVTGKEIDEILARPTY